MTTRKKTHKIVLSVRFDKACSITTAVKAVADCIHGSFYPAAFMDSDPEEFRIGRVTRPPSRTA